MVAFGAAMRTWLISVFLSIGCGVAARPLHPRGATVEAGAVTDGSQMAWFRCGKPRHRSAAPLTVVARYRGCSIVLAPTRDDAEARRDVPLGLGRAEHLTKTDPAALVKALARYELLHVVVRRRQSAPDPADVEEGVPAQRACRSRGMPNDFDCRPEAIAIMLADQDVEELELWNRFWVRWK